MSALHNHHVQFGSQQEPWLRIGDHGCTCGLQSFHGPLDPSVCSAPPPQGVHLGRGDGLALCNTWTSSRLWTTGLNMFKWGLCQTWRPPLCGSDTFLLEPCTMISYCVFPSFYWLYILAAGSLLSEAVIPQETSIFQHAGRTWLNEQDSPAWQ